MAQKFIIGERSSIGKFGAVLNKKKVSETEFWEKLEKSVKEFSQGNASEEGKVLKEAKKYLLKSTPVTLDKTFFQITGKP